MTKAFSFITIEDKKYPTVIMGEDNFTGWFGKGVFAEEEERAKSYRLTLETAYSLGVRGFSISPHDTLLDVLREFKKTHPDVVCIANPHWQSHYYLGEESLWKNELISKSNTFTEEQIKSIRLDEAEYREQLKKFDFCDFCLVGNVGRSALLIAGREDILRKEIEIVRKYGFIPLGMCEGASVLPKLETLDVAGSWVRISKHYAFPTLEAGLRAVKGAKKPVTAYKVLSGPGELNITESIQFIKSIKQITAIVIGVENQEQAKETFSIVRKILVAEDVLLT